MDKNPDTKKYFFPLFLTSLIRKNILILIDSIFSYDTISCSYYISRQQIFPFYSMNII